MSSFDAFSIDSDYQHLANDDNFFGYSSYSRFSGSDVPIVDHTFAVSSEIFRFSNPDPNLPLNWCMKQRTIIERWQRFLLWRAGAFIAQAIFTSQAIALWVVKVVEGRREREGKDGGVLRRKKKRVKLVNHL